MAYSRLPQDEASTPSSLPVRRTSRSSYVGLGVLVVFVAFIGYWACGRISEDLVSSFSNGEKHLVIASYLSQNVSWLSEVPTEWNIKRYMMDDPTPDPDVGLSVPRNFGREAMAYMTYIIDHYDSLPDHAVFIHGHYQSWHQPAPISKKIRALNLTALDDEGYISLRCGNNMGCERRPYLDTFHVNWDGENYIREFWQTIVPQQEMPRYISYKCCAQFAVSRKAIQTRSREEWIHIREPLLRSPEETKKSEIWAKGVDDLEWKFGSFYEKLWHLFFGMDPEYCPSQDQCNMVHFSNAIICAGDQDLTPYEYDLWKENIFKTAFDGIDPDQAVNWTTWNHNLISYSGDIGKERNKMIQAKTERLRVLEAEHAESTKHHDSRWNGHRRIF